MVFISKRPLKIGKLWLYIARWQFSSPILFVIILLLNWPTWIEVIIANLIGALVFYKVDKYILKRK